uniref:Uncharacterized protein n=1 Tax=Loigolactobacillus rennini TaxID=238013 RepID=A0A1K2I770_9LACO|nr:hypothetical protein LREN565_1351 [Loigolactobacillus rennini]
MSISLKLGIICKANDAQFVAKRKQLPVQARFRSNSSNGFAKQMAPVCS